MKKKILSIVFCIGLVFSLWGRGPTPTSPYEIFDETERNYQYYGLGDSNKIKEIRNDDTWIITLYRKNRKDHIVFRYKKDVPNKSQIEKMLDKNQSIWKDYNYKNGEDIGLVHIFLRPGDNLIISAEYKECSY